MIWLKFAVIQLAMLAATVAGWFILLPFCIAQAWERDYDSGLTMGCSGYRIRWQYISIKDGRPIDGWSFFLLNTVYGNPEDGVSGQTALVWNRLGSNQIPYKPTRWAWLDAYLWSAWRNSCDNLKYVFADPKGPRVTFEFIGRTAKIGWQMENGYNVPVFSL